MVKMPIDTRSTGEYNIQKCKNMRMNFAFSPYAVCSYRRILKERFKNCCGEIPPHRNETTFDEWMGLDMKYIQKRRFLVDWKITPKTVAAVIYGSGE